jgi:hypothetical protein
MVAHQPSHREDAGAAVPAGSRGPAHLGEGARTGIEGRRDGGVVDHVAVADDHGNPFLVSVAPRSRVAEVRLT